jgi:hypothetical protein
MEGSIALFVPTIRPYSARMRLAQTAVVSALGLLGMGAVAHAEESQAPAAPLREPVREPSPPEVTAAMTNYFHGEKNQGYLWGMAGASGLTMGAGLYVLDKPFERAASYPIFIVGVIQSVVAVLSFVRPDGRIKANEERIGQNPSLFLSEERERVRTVNRFFVGIELFETAVAVTGIGLVGAGLHDHDRTLQGVGTGLVVQGAAMFLLDSIAHERAERYENLLLGGAASKEGATFSMGGRF